MTLNSAETPVAKIRPSVPHGANLFIFTGYWPRFLLCLIFIIQITVIFCERVVKFTVCSYSSCSCRFSFVIQRRTIHYGTLFIADHFVSILLDHHLIYEDVD